MTDIRNLITSDVKQSLGKVVHPDGDAENSPSALDKAKEARQRIAEKKHDARQRFDAVFAQGREAANDITAATDRIANQMGFSGASQSSAPSTATPSHGMNGESLHRSAEGRGK